MRIHRRASANSRLRAQRTLARTNRSKVSLASITLVLFASAGLLGWFGIQDFVGALTFAGRITGAVLIAVAFTTLLGAVAVADHWLWHSFRYSGLVALIGTFAALLTDFLVLAEILKDGDSAFFKTLFGVLTAGSAWAVFSVFRTSVDIPAPKRVAATLIVTTVIAVANFGYQSLYLPSQREVRPVIKLAVGKSMTSPDGTAFSVPVDITIENRSDSAFYVLGSEVHAMAEKVPVTMEDQHEQWRADAEQWAKFEEVNPLSRWEKHEPGELVSAQPWVPFGGWIYANDTFSARVVVQLPMNTNYDQLAFYASAHLTRKDRARVERLGLPSYSWRGAPVPSWVTKHKEVDALVYKSRVHENNAIDETTREPRYLTVYWRFGPHGADLVEAISTEDGTNEPQEAVEGRYGVRLVETGPVERPLADIKMRR